MNENDNTKLKSGYTTGACATVAVKASLLAIVNGKKMSKCSITLPKGQNVEFKLNSIELDITNQTAKVDVIKDAGDDPDITHGAVIRAIVEVEDGENIVTLKAGRGVGIVTKPGLPIDVGKPAITPVPEKMMRDVVAEILKDNKINKNVKITIEIDKGEEMTRQTWNPRLGIVGGLSVLGTTGIVHPYSCSAWIHSLHRGIDVARAEGAEHIIAATGSTSQAVAQKIYNLPEVRCLDMGDFVGGVVKYLRKYPVSNITIAGGFAKMVKLAQGEMDLHSQRSQVDFEKLAEMVGSDKEKIMKAQSAAQVLEMTKEIDDDLPINLSMKVAKKALGVVEKNLRDAPVNVEIIIVDRVGGMLARVKGE